MPPCCRRAPLRTGRFGVWLSGLVASACIGRGEPLELHAHQADAGELPIGAPIPGAADAGLGPIAVHSVINVNPSSGPFKGGVRAIVRGTGFSSEARVWFGDNEVPKADIVPIDPNRVQVIVNPGEPGSVDVSVQNGDDLSTKSTLRAGFVYDAFYAEPALGPTSGGTRITLHGMNVDWTSDTLVLIDNIPCPLIALRGGSDGTQQLECESPPGSAGSKPVTTTNQDGTKYEVLGGFTYSNSDNGFRGGLSGALLDNQLQVLVVDSLLGSVVAEASVLLGSEPSAESDTMATTDSQGLAQLTGNFGPTQTVTIAKECYHPITFVDVPVDRVTVYLDPVMSPACVPPQDDPPLVPSGGFVVGASVEGELVWTGNREFEDESWINVPPPVVESERRVAYLFEATNNPWRSFSLPRVSLAVTEEDQSGQGFAFRTDTSVGNLTLYALAGVEDLTRQPPLFQAYAIGLVRGVGTEPLGTTRDVFIAMDNTLDQSLRFEIDGPTPTSRGPDRVDVAVALRIGNEGYAILPGGQKSSLLPSDNGLLFAGLPPLVGSLQSAQYVATARARTGLTQSLPVSEIGLFSSNNAALPILLSGFVEVPQLAHPETGATWDGRSLQVNWEAGGPDISLLVFDVVSAGGLINWRIVAPGPVPAGEELKVQLPDLRGLVSQGDLESGALQILVSAAQLDDFDYANLAYADLFDSRWRAFAADAFQARY